MANELHGFDRRLEGGSRRTGAAIDAGILRRAGDDRGASGARRDRAESDASANAVQRRVRGVAGCEAHAQIAQRRREKVAVAIGAVLGLVLWFPVVWLTPFGGAHWLAAAVIGGDRWAAGSWARMVRL
jgi:hypothetical protein